MELIYRTRAGQQEVARWCRDQLDEWRIPHSRQLLTVQGVPTHVVTAGEGGRTVVFLPGTNFSAATCLPLATALCTRSRDVLVDLPGQPGLSSAERIPRDGRLEWNGRWLTELIDQLADGPTVVMGHSLGAAVTLSSDLPRVERQVLVSPGGLTKLRLSPAVITASVAWVLRRSPAASAKLLRTMHAPGSTPRPLLVDWMTLLARHVRTSTDPGKVRIAARDVNRSVLVGDSDVFMPVRTLAPAVHDTLGIEIQVVSSAGHLVIEEHPERLAHACLG